jgi:hypothetical protein
MYSYTCLHCVWFDLGGVPGMAHVEIAGGRSIESTINFFQYKLILCLSTYLN